MNHFKVDILTPEKVVAKDVPAESLIIPTIRGQINVLPDHTHVITRLSTGVLSVFGGADDPDRHFTVTYGVCKVVGDQVTILSHTSEENHELDLERAERAKQQAEDYLRSHDDLSDEDIEKYRRKIERAEIRIQLAKKI